MTSVSNKPNQVPLAAEGLTLTRSGTGIVSSFSARFGDTRGDQGELVAIVGPNGSGKTTLLQGLAGLLSPTAGNVKVHGQILAELSPLPRAKLIAYLEQNPRVHWRLTVEAVIRLGVPQEKVWWFSEDPLKKEFLEHICDLTFCQDLRHHTIQDLSSGEQMRAHLARLLIANTPVVLADEPTANLDPFYQLQCMQLLSNIAAQGKTVVVVLHDLTLATRFCNRMILLNKGTIVADGRPSEVLSEANLRRVFQLKASAVAGETGLKEIGVAPEYPWTIFND